MEADEKRALLALCLIPGLGSVHIRRLLDFFGSASDVLAASAEELDRVAGLPPTVARRVAQGRSLEAAERELERVAREGCSLVTLGDPGYPEMLRNIYDPPPVLYLKGRLIPQDDRAIAVVGTRHPTSYGRQVTERLVHEMAAYGFTIVSGLARGIDGTAHRAALEAGTRTIAVLGSGLGRIYPPEHRELAEAIAEQGALVSEFPMEAPPLAAHFPQRNRVISGLSLGVLITEAAERSGSLITARYALEQDREVMAVPGDILSEGSRGPHRLIQQGAALIASGEDILRTLPVYGVPEQAIPGPPEPVDLPELNPEERTIWEALGNTALHIDGLIQKVDMPPSRVASVLMLLELKGLVQQLPGKWFARKWSKGPPHASEST